MEAKFIHSLNTCILFFFASTMYINRATNLCMSLKVSSWLRHGSNMLCNSVEFKIWTLISRRFFICLEKPYTPRKAIEQYKYPIKSTQAGGVARQSVMEGWGMGTFTVGS